MMNTVVYLWLNNLAPDTRKEIIINLIQSLAREQIEPPAYFTEETLKMLEQRYPPNLIKSIGQCRTPY